MRCRLDELDSLSLARLEEWGSEMFDDPFNDMIEPDMCTACDAEHPIGSECFIDVTCYGCSAITLCDMANVDIEAMECSGCGVTVNGSAFWTVAGTVAA
jgi:hypothetical protein